MPVRLLLDLLKPSYYEVDLNEKHSTYHSKIPRLKTYMPNLNNEPHLLIETKNLALEYDCFLLVKIRQGQPNAHFSLLKT